MAETNRTQAEPQRPAQPQPPQPVLEKTPFQAQQMMQFVPYAPGQQMQPLLQPPVANELPFSRRWHIAKIVLGSVSLLSSVVMWAVSIVILARFTGSSDDYSYDSFQIPFEVAFAMAAAGIAIIWQAAEFITIFVSKTNRGIHPGANVALHLIIWLVAILAVGFLATFVAFDIEVRDEILDSESTYNYHQFDQSQYSALIGLEAALLAFTCLMFLMHFILFVRACVETQQFNNHNRPATRTVYVQMPIQGMEPGQQTVGYFAYQQLPGQPLPFAQPQQQPHVQGGPVQPQQAHLYGYYAPGPVSGMPPQMAQTSQTPIVPGPNHPMAGHHAPPAGSVSPVTSSDHT